jgi:hypothetical protein
MVIWSESCALRLGAVTRLTLAKAITDAKTNFFIQCSWVLPKWKSKLMRSIAKNTRPVEAVVYRGDESTIPRLSNVLEGL